MKQRIAAAAISVWLIFGVALGVRAAYAWSQARAIPPKDLAAASFAQETGNIAQAIASGRGFSDPFRQPTGPTAWLAPLYPLLLAGIFRLFGIFSLASFWVAASFNMLASAAACVPLYFAGKRISGTALGAGAAWLWAIFPNGAIVPFYWIWGTSLAALFAATILWATLAIDASGRRRHWISYGVLWGVALLNSPAIGSLAPFLFGWLAWRRKRRGMAWFGKPALAACVVLLCLVPWTARNYARFHRLVPLRSDFPFELWMGNNPVWNPRGRNPMAAVTRYGQVREYIELGETAFLQKKWREATAFMRGHKRLEVWLTKRRIVALWLGSADPILAFRGTRSPFIRFLLVVNGLVALGAVAGILALGFRRSAYAFPVAAFPIVYPCVYYMTITSLRYLYPIEPVLMLLGAAGVAAIFRRKDAASSVTA